MKGPLLVFAALGFLAQVTPAHGGVTRCGRNIPGHCRLYCHQNERTMFMCDRYKQCCILSDFLPAPVGSPIAAKSKASGVQNHRKPAQEPTTNSYTATATAPATATATAPDPED